jgi:hypothetical protein
VFACISFRNVISGTSTTVRSFRYIKLTRANQEAFRDNLYSAYVTMMKGSKQEALTLGEYMKLLSMVCADFPKELAEGVFKVFSGSEMAPVSFDVFASGIRICVLYDEFLAQCKLVYDDLRGEDDHVDKGSYLESIQQVLATHQHLGDGSQSFFLRVCDQLDEICLSVKMSYHDVMRSLISLASVE